MQLMPGSFAIFYVDITLLRWLIIIFFFKHLPHYRVYLCSHMILYYMLGTTGNMPVKSGEATLMDFNILLLIFI